jgi:hypothetical protein
LAARGPGTFQEWIDWKYLQAMLMAVVSLGVLHFSQDHSAKILYYLAGVGPLFFLLFTLVVGGPCVIVFVARELFSGWSRALMGASVESVAVKKHPV